MKTIGAASILAAILMLALGLPTLGSAQDVDDSFAEVRARALATLPSGPPVVGVYERYSFLSGATVNLSVDEASITVTQSAIGTVQVSGGATWMGKDTSGGPNMGYFDGNLQRVGDYFQVVNPTTSSGYCPIFLSFSATGLIASVVSYPNSRFPPHRVASIDFEIIDASPAEVEQVASDVLLFPIQSFKPRRPAPGDSPAVCGNPGFCCPPVGRVIPTAAQPSWCKFCVAFGSRW